MQLSFLETGEVKNSNLIRETFSHNKIAPEKERIGLEEKYAYLLEETEEFNRKLVSYQGNKGKLIHSWIKYKEGFSAQLVETLIRKYKFDYNDLLLDPFSGSSTTLLVSKSLGINAVGIELLPNCHLAWEAKSYTLDYDIEELKDILILLEKSESKNTQGKIPSLNITEGAFSKETENEILYFSNIVEGLQISEHARILLHLLITSILEEVSYTKKDGQYLRWDYRSPKVIKRNKKRISQGKKPAKKVDKGTLPSVKESLINALRIVISDIQKIQTLPFKKSHQELIKGNALFVLPTLEENKFNGVITSPPYCNRYDYTRTYALELAYLGTNEEEIKNLRQSLLSCTVENHPKIEQLRNHYNSLGLEDRYFRILTSVENNAVFQEINDALKIRWDRKEINNRGVLRMVKNYFIESTFIFAELHRICKDNAPVIFVNDNVRYGGEVIPVDLLTTNLAEGIGFEPEKVYVLPQRKGNSSQQMGKFGREALRKSITIWRKSDGKAKSARVRKNL